MVQRKLRGLVPTETSVYVLSSSDSSVLSVIRSTVYPFITDSCVTGVEGGGDGEVSVVFLSLDDCLNKHFKTSVEGNFLSRGWSSGEDVSFLGGPAKCFPDKFWKVSPVKYSIFLHFKGTAELRSDAVCWPVWEKKVKGETSETFKKVRLSQFCTSPLPRLQRLCFQFFR